MDFVISRLMGGLGNQMFQYAFARNIANKNNANLFFDTTFLDSNIEGIVKRNFDLDIFGIQKNKISTKELSNFFRYGDKFSNKIYNFINKNILNKIVYNESPHDFDEKYLKINKNAYLYGQWGSYKYFESIADIIKEEFTIILKNEIVIEHLLDDIKNNNSVCLNVRRADFVNNSFHVLLGMEYYIKAIEHIDKEVNNPVYYIFSDDIEWCKNNFSFLKNAVFVSHEYAGEKFSSYLYLMIQCKHYIIPNSTFAWWAAWLNNELNKIVIAPNKWYTSYNFELKDLIPSTWITL